MTRAKIKELVKRAIQKAGESRDRYWKRILADREKELSDSYNLEMGKRDAEVLEIARRMDENRKTVARSRKVYKECIRRIKEDEKMKRELEFQVERMETILGEFAQAVHSSIDIIEDSRSKLIEAKTFTEKQLNLAVVNGGKK